MIYLTYNDAPSGIYNSQVIDVVNYLNTLSSKKVKLIALISIRNYGHNKKKIKSRCANAIVIPMIPKARNWKWNRISLFFYFLFHRDKKIIARGPFATNLALSLKKINFCKKVIFDARGAYNAELKEYEVVKDQFVINQIKELENQAIHLSDYKLAVSNALVNYWRSDYQYEKNNHVVVPCTLGEDFLFEFPSEEIISKKKKELGYQEDDIIFIYSGSSAGWQSFQLIDDKMCQILTNPKIKLIILSNHIDNSLKAIKSHPKNVSTLFVEPNQVRDYLLISDYGIIYREQSITNKVASPVKFAEYMSCGLKLLISENLGDYTNFSKTENLIINTDKVVSPNYSEKKQIHNLSNQYFKKETYKSEYLTLLNR